MGAKVAVSVPGVVEERSFQPLVLPDDHQRTFAERIELAIGESWVRCGVTVDGAVLYATRMSVVARVDYWTEVHVEYKVQTGAGESEVRHDVFVARSVTVRS